MFSSLLFSTSVEHKIKVKKKQLTAKKIEYKKMDRKLSIVAKKIFSAKKEQKILASKLTVLAKNLKNNEAEFLHLKKEEKSFSNELSKINGNIDAKQKKFLDLVAKNFSLALALEELNQPTPDSIMMKEAYKLYAKKNSDEINALEKEIGRLNNQKSDLTLQKSHIEKQIAKYMSERKEYKSKKKKQDKLVKALARDKAIYKKRFNKIKTSRRSLERKLSKLKIVKRRNKKVAKERATEARLASNRSQTSKAPKIIASAPSAKYSGGKTISPLKGARLIKKFGTYIDPIYKFKIFNKSVTLKAPYAGSKVRSVLAGKVVFAENSGGMLGKVVIVEHRNGIHTIYAKLSRLAPGIHVGKHLSKGSVIGKVERSLMFEVTKNNRHMNPMKLIRL